MHYETDQSGKVEQTDKDTVVAITNGKSCTVFLSRKEKRKLRKYFNEIKDLKHFPQKVFTVLLAESILKLKPERKVVIDTEYLGHESYILEKLWLILEIFGMERKKIHIEFGFVGKHSKSHDLAYKVATKRIKPTKILTCQDIIRILEKQKKLGSCKA